MKTLAALSLFLLSLSSFAQNEVTLSYQQSGNFLHVSKAQVETKGRQSILRATVIFSNSCFAAAKSDVVYASKINSNGDKLSVSLIALPATTTRICPMVFRPVNVDYLIPVDAFGPNDALLNVTINGVVAR